MGLRERLAALAVGATHVLVVDAPGAWRTRVAVEQEISQRGWRLAMSPSDADALVVVGRAGPELMERVNAVWEQLPGPRSRVDVADVDGVRSALDSVTQELLDDASQARDARIRTGPDVGDMGSDHGDMEMDHDMDDDGDMEMDHDMEMAPSGISLAEGREDRDGLEMDVLHLPLGPVLPHWPAGLVLRCTLAGDVVVNAEANVLDDGHATGTRLTPSVRAARRCDQAADVLGLAGWPAGRSAALHVRDDLLEGMTPSEAVTRLDGLERRLRKARLLHWSLCGIAVVVPGDDPEEATQHLRGDVYDRLMDLIARARIEVVGEDLRHIAPEAVLGIAEQLVFGLDLAAARLVVASLGIDTSATQQDRVGCQGG